MSFMPVKPRFGNVVNNEVHRIESFHVLDSKTGRQLLIFEWPASW